jgi:phage nucleotide-binding protein
VELIKGFLPVGETKQYIKALIYGPAGSGKTRFCADAPNPIWADFESSTETLRHWPEYSHIPIKRPENVEELKNDVRKAISDPDVDTVVIDTVTTCLEYYLRQHMNAQVKRDKYTLYESDYKYATQVFLDLFGILQLAPINVVFIGHERIVRDATSGQITAVYPDITPRLQQGITRLVNVVAYMEALPSNNKGVTRKLYLNRTSKVEAKNRLNIPDIYIENPSWKEIFNA